jgi:hypothetical protein
MSELDILKWIVLGALGLISWFLQHNLADSKDRITHLENDMQSMRRDYLHKDDFKDFKMELRAMFEELRKDIRAVNEKS